MKIKLLTPLGSNTVSYSIGDTLEVGVEQALRMVEERLATPVNKKEYAEVIKSYTEKVNALREEEVRREALLNKEGLILELNAKYREVVELESRVAGVVLDKLQKEKLIEDLKRRENEISTNGSTD